MLSIDVKGKRAFVAGIADDAGFGFAIAKSLMEAGASVCVGTWAPAYNIFVKMLERGKFDASMTLSDGSKMGFEKIYALDAEYDTLQDIPEEVRTSRRYRDHSDVSLGGVAQQVQADFGPAPLDIVIHSLANGPEVKHSLLQTSRRGYLAAMGASAYSFVSMVQRFGPILKPGGSFVALSYLAAQKVVPFYGGGMSSAKSALESDTRVLAYEAGRKWGHRVNTISAGPYNSRAASAIGPMAKVIGYVSQNAPLTEPMTAQEVGDTAAFLCSPLASGITGSVVYVDKGFHTMGMSSEVADEMANSEQ